jgi:hypothetical protein
VPVALEAPEDGKPTQFESEDDLLTEEDEEGEIDFEPSTQIEKTTMVKM